VHIESTMEVSMKNKIIAVDFDDLIGDFNRAYIQHHNNRYGSKLLTSRCIHLTWPSCTE